MVADPDRIPRFERVRYSVLPSYDQRAMVREVLAMDIGIFPMFHVDESLYRGTLKTRVYMSGEAAVIAERFGENESLIDEGSDGVLAGDDEEWVDGLSALIEDQTLRRSIAKAGREKMEQSFSRENCYERLRNVILG